MILHFNTLTAEEMGTWSRLAIDISTVTPISPYRTLGDCLFYTIDRPLTEVELSVLPPFITLHSGGDPYPNVPEESTVER